MLENKRGISPVIATVLLIVVAIILFLLIYLWVRSFQQEAVLKFNAPVETSCTKVSYSAIISGNMVQLTNTGDLPIYRFELYNVTSSGTKLISGGSALNIMPASSATITGVNCKGAKLKVLPYLLGKTSSGKEKEAACEKQAKLFNC